MGALLGLGVRIDECARRETWRPQDGLCPGGLELRYIVALDVLVLHMKDSSVRPSAAGTKLHIANNRAERVIARESRELCVVERSRAANGLLNDLHLRVRLRH